LIHLTRTPLARGWIATATAHRKSLCLWRWRRGRGRSRSGGGRRRDRRAFAEFPISNGERGVGHRIDRYRGRSRDNDAVNDLRHNRNARCVNLTRGKNICGLSINSHGDCSASNSALLSKVFNLQKYVLSQVEDDWLAAGGNNLGMKRTSENNGRAGEQRQEDRERAGATVSYRRNLLRLRQGFKS
jgi:hypothetical protein